MSEPKTGLPSSSLIQAGTIIVGLAVGWAALDARSQAANETIKDHETRMRTLERDVLSGLARIEQRLDQIERTSP